MCICGYRSSYVSVLGVLNGWRFWLTLKGKVWERGESGNNEKNGERKKKNNQN